MDAVPVTTVSRTLLDLAEIVDARRLARAFEEADRLGVLDLQDLRKTCERAHGRHGLKALRPLIEAARMPEYTRSDLEDRVVTLCRSHDLPAPHTNVEVLGREVDACWPSQKVIVEADGWDFHRHRAAFERDRARDSALLAAGYRVVRLTHRRLERESNTVVAELRRLLNANPPRAVH